MELVVKLIQLIHILVRIFIIAVPFIGGEYMLTIHVIIIPFIMLHWATNQTVCALTELEKMARGGCKDEDTFFGKVITPIYKNESFVGTIISPFYTIEDKETEKMAVWIGLTLLWLITLFRLQQTDFAQLRADFIALRRTMRF